MATFTKTVSAGPGTQPSCSMSISAGDVGVTSSKYYRITGATFKASAENSSGKILYVYPSWKGQTSVNASLWGGDWDIGSGWNFPYKASMEAWANSANCKVYLTLTLTYEKINYNPIATPSIYASASSVPSGTSFEISWSAESASGNTLTGFDIYRDGGLLMSVGADTRSITQTFTVSADKQVSYYVVAKGSMADSDPSSTVYVNVLNITAPKDISATTNKQIISASEAIYVSWQNSADGDNNPLTGYILSYRDSTNNNTEWTAVTQIAQVGVDTISYWTYPNPNRGCYRQYIVQPIAERLNGNAAYTPIVYSTLKPPKPVVVVPEEGQVRINRAITITVEAHERKYDVYAVIDGETVLLKSDCAYAAGTLKLELPDTLTAGPHSLYLYTKDAYDTSNNSETVNFTYSPIEWDEDFTIVKAIHVNQLREAINMVRQAKGLDEYEWEENITDHTGQPTIIKAAHWQELQKAIEFNLPNPIEVKAGGRILKSVLLELRNAVEEG